MNDEIILVDLNDKSIGHNTKTDAHKLGQLHRAFSVFIYHDNKLLIQKRNINKYHSGGLWANACCSHPRKNEPLLLSVQRRLLEELRISCNVEELFSFTYYEKYNEFLYEYEYDHVFLGEYYGPINFNTDEIEEIKWIDINELKEDLVKFPSKYAVWFIIAAPKVIEFIENKKGI